MSKTDTLMSYLPQFLFDSPIMQDLFKQYGNELQNLDDSTNDLMNQLFPQTATWGLKLWEQYLGIPVNESLDVVTRRSKIMAQISTISPLSVNKLSDIFSKYADSSNVIQNFSDYSFDLTLITKNVFNLIFSDIIRNIENIKPCHLDYSLDLETQRKLNIQSKYFKNNINYKLTGNIKSGSTYNKKNSNSLYPNIVKIASTYNISNNPYPICGETTL
jgi:hypothetical protein